VTGIDVFLMSKTGLIEASRGFGGRLAIAF
jgi:hypothetical protein